MAVLVGGTVPSGPGSWAAGRGSGAPGCPGFDGGRDVGAGLAGGRGVGLGVGASACGGSSPTIALGWMLRSWFLLPAPSSWSVRICHGAPETSDAPSRAPPAAVSQYLDWARWPPHARRTADPVERKRTRISAVLLPLTFPACAGRLIDVIVPPQIVRRRGAPEYFSAPETDRPFALNVSDGMAALDEAGRLGHIDEIAPPLGVHALPAAFVTFHVARKSYALCPLAVKS